MPVDESSEENILNDLDAYYEAVASQEEIYLGVEEELCAILIFGDQTSRKGNAERLLSEANNDPCVVESPKEPLITDAAEELIAGDSDDPPLSEEGVAEMLRMARIPKGFPPDM